jgi:hypothetical protein
MIVRELTTVLGFEIEESKLRRFEALISITRRQVGNLQTDIEGIGNAIKTLGFGLTAFVTLPFTIASGVMIKAASDAEETRNKFDVIFRDIKDKAHDTATSFAADFGLAEDTALDLLGGTADLAAGFGFTQERALDLANQAQRLAGDLASFQNIQGGVREAGQRLTRGILGETENLKLLGIAVNQGDKEFRKLVKSIMAAEGLTERQSRVVAILRIAYEQSANAIGDFARTMTSLSNQIKILRENIRKILVSFGKLLIPVALIIVKVFNKLLMIIEKLPKPLKAIILGFTALVAVIGPLIIMLGILIASFGMLILKFLLLSKILAFFGLSSIGLLLKFGSVVFGLFTRFTLLRFAVIWLAKFFAILTVKILLIVAAIAAVVAIIALVIEDFAVWAQGGESVVGLILGSFERMKERFQVIIDAIKNAFVALWIALTTDSRAAWNEFSKQLGIVDGAINNIIGDIGRRIEDLAPKLAKLLIRLVPKVLMMWWKLLFGIVDTIRSMLVSLIKFLIQDLTNAITRRLPNVRRTIMRKFPRLAEVLGIWDIGEDDPGKAPSRRRPGGRPAGRIAPSQVMAGIGGLRKPTGGVHNKFETDITLQIPAGMSEEESSQWTDRTKEMIEDALQQSYNQSELSNPVVEK